MLFHLAGEAIARSAAGGGASREGPASASDGGGAAGGRGRRGGRSGAPRRPEPGHCRADAGGAVGPTETPTHLS